MSSALENLRAFLAVTEEGSFVLAAENLGVPRTTLRRQVEALEALTGTPLFRRGREGAVLTDAGQRLAARGREVEREFSSLLQEVRESGQRPAGEVRALTQIGVHPGAGLMLMARLRAAWPDVRIRLRFAESPLSERLADVDIVTWIGPERLEGDWETHVIMPLRQRLFADQAYLRAHGTPRTVRDLAAYEVFAWVPAGEAQRDVKLPTSSGTLFTLRPVLTTTDIHVVHECVGQQLGIGWAPDAALPGVEGQIYQPVLESLVGREMALRVAVPTAFARVPKLRVVVDSVRALPELFGIMPVVAPSDLKSE